MFGYTLPLYQRMTAADVDAYQRYYCETCHQLRDGYGLVSTAAVNYDMTFNLIVLSAVDGRCTSFPGTPASLRCVFRHHGAESELFRAMAGYTVILTKWELYDDKVDKPSAKTGFINLVLSKAISRAEEEYPEFDTAVGEGFARLRDLETEGCSDAIRMGRSFGEALSAPMESMVDESLSSDLRGLFTSLTAAVYVMDAMDDLDSDFMDGTFNPFLTDRESYVNRCEFMGSRMYEMARLSRRCMEDLQNSYKRVKPEMKDLTGVTDNIIYFGVPESAKNAIAGRGAAKASVKNALDHRSERNATY